jgi:hypothetical protein
LQQWVFPVHTVLPHWRGTITSDSSVGSALLTSSSGGATDLPQNSRVQAPPFGAQTPQLSLQQNVSPVQTLLPHGSPALFRSMLSVHAPAAIAHPRQSAAIHSALNIPTSLQLDCIRHSAISLYRWLQTSATPAPHVRVSQITEVAFDVLAARAQVDQNCACSVLPSRASVDAVPAEITSATWSK